MASSVERFLQRYQNNRASIAKWAAIAAIAWSLLALAVLVYGTASGNFSAMGVSVKLVMPPVLIAGVAWGTARSVRGSRRDTVLPMGAVWFCLIVVFVVMFQYNSVVFAPTNKSPGTQTEQGLLREDPLGVEPTMYMKGW
jgi:uncharacterized membrane protein